MRDRDRDTDRDRDKRVTWTVFAILAMFLFPWIAFECDGEVCSGPKCVLRLWSEWGHLDHVPLVGWCASASASANNSARNSASSIVPHVFWLLMGSLSAYTAPPSKRIN